MTLREKIGQLFILGFQGTSVSKEFSHLLAFYKPAGVILFSRNLDNPFQAATLANELQSYASQVPLWISIDHEGGSVFRLPNGLTPLPSSGELGRRNSAELVSSVATVGARELNAIGVNLNYAPVLDLNTNPNNPIIGERSFGVDLDIVVRFCRETITAYEKNRILACGKHFPGHGDTNTDSHLQLPVILHSVKQLHARELQPFVQLIGQNLSAMMTAHVKYSFLDPVYPASLSYPIQTELLRNQLQFKGLIFSDDLEMAGVTNHVDLLDAVLLAVEAGTDHLLICHTETQQIGAMEKLYKAVVDQRIAESRIDESLDRIMRYKEKYLMPYTPVDPHKVNDCVGLPSHRQIVETVTETS